MRVADILKEKGNLRTYSVSPGCSVAEAVLVMDQHKVGAVLVTEDGILAGLLTLREVVAQIARRQREQADLDSPLLSKIQVVELMFTPRVVSPDTDVETLRSLFVQARQRYLPVVARGVVVGVLSLHDLERALLEEQDFENRMLRSYVELPVSETRVTTGERVPRRALQQW